MNTEVIRRSGGRCEARVSPDCTYRLEHAHHIARRWHGGNEADNLLGVCSACHSWCHLNVAAAEKLGFLKRSGPLPPVVNTKVQDQ